MPRKRNLILGFFDRSRTTSPAPTAQQANSNVVSMTSLARAHGGATSTSGVHPLLTQAASSVGSPVTQAAPAIESSAKEMATVAWESVKTALILLQESSDWFPQLKAATGGFLALVNAIEVSETIFSLSLHSIT